MPAFTPSLIVVSLTLLICAAAEEDANKRPQPQFRSDNRTDNFLASDEVWVPGTTTLITMRMVEEPLEISVELLNGSASFREPKLYLLYKCSFQTGSFDEKALPITVTGKKDESIFCEHRQPFSIQQVKNQDNRFILQLIDNEGKVKFDESLDLSLEIAIRVKYNGNQLTSSSLLIYNWDSALKFKNETFSGKLVPISAKNSTQREHILSDLGLEFISHHFGFLYYPRRRKFKFLREEFVQMVNKSSLLVRSHLTVTVMIRYNSSSCSAPWNPNSDVTISSGIPNTVSNSYSGSNRFQSCYFLDLHTGELHLNDYLLHELLKEVVSKQRKKGTLEIFGCLSISTNNQAWRYRALKNLNYAALVDPRPFLSSSNFSGFPTRTDCHSSMARIEVQLFSGMQDVLLKTPITCDRRHTMHRLFFNGTVCAGYIRGDGFRNCDQYSVSELYTAIRFDGRLGMRHAGVYTLVTNNIRFEYVVNVISFPLFYSETRSGALKSTTVVTELVKLFNLTCSTFQSGMPPVTIKPLFIVNIKLKPQEMAGHQFTSYLGTAPQNLVQKRSDNYSSSSLQMFMPYVDKPGDKPSTFVVVCRASITAAATKNLLGTTVQYSTETRATVRYEQNARTFSDFVSKLISTVPTMDSWLLIAALCVAATTRNFSDDLLELLNVN